MIEQLDDVIRVLEHEWSTKRLLVVGDLMLDKYIWGDVRRISPEAPVPVVHAVHQNHRPGGAANVAMNIARLGAETQVIGFTGGDADERLLQEGLTKNGVSCNFIACEGFPTIAKVRVLGGNQQMLRLDYERIGVRSQCDQDRLIQAVIDEIPKCQAVVLSDYAKGMLTPELCQRSIARARELGIPILVDPKSTDFSHYRGATTICPNLGELARAIHHVDTRDTEELLKAADNMAESLNLDFVTVTMSEKGIALLGRKGRYVAPAVAKQVFDVSGAGDTVVAVMAISLASGFSNELSAQLANLAAGVVVGKVGTVPIEKHELLAELGTSLALQSANKVISRDELIMRAAMWKKNGERIVFTNGCFDLLHVGHISVIEQARRLGDRLILAINSDRSVSKLKGPNRPVVGENERARVLAALAAVDAVVIFDEQTPLDLILATRPNVLVKGGDYNPSSVVGAKEVLSWGGQIHIVPTIEGISTTTLIEKSIR